MHKKKQHSGIVGKPESNTWKYVQQNIRALTRDGLKQKQTNKRGEKKCYFLIVQYLEMFPTSIQYLRIVSNIVTQADEAGFKFFRAKSAGVVLVMQCTR